jgi:hypothetical protein
MYLTILNIMLYSTPRMSNLRHEGCMQQTFLRKSIRLFKIGVYSCQKKAEISSLFLFNSENLDTHVEAGSNTSTVTLRVVGGDEMGSLKSKTVKYGREYQGTRTRERLHWEDPAAYSKDRPVLSSERAPHKNKTVTVKQ